MDHNFTRLLKKWLETAPEERDYTVGALYLLKLSGNKIMYANIVANIDRRHEIVEYQLQKYYNFRVKELTHAQVEEMQQKVDAIVEEHIPLAAEADTQRVGKRDDHDLLPDSIKALYVENLSLLQRMRELHLRLRSLSLENVTCPDSERYPFLKEMIALDKKLHSNWERYDHYVAPTDPTAKAAATPSSSQTLRSAKNKAVSRKKSATK